MANEMNAMIELAREQIELVSARRDRAVYVSLSTAGISISVEPWPEDDCEGN